MLLLQKCAVKNGDLHNLRAIHLKIQHQLYSINKINKVNLHETSYFQDKCYLRYNLPTSYNFQVTYKLQVT